MLAYKGTGLLGTMCGTFRSKVHWAYVQDGTPCTCRHNFDRILRSISQLSSEIPDSNQTNNTSSSYIKDDMMDIVATTGPYDGKGIPGPDELAPSAQLLLDDKSASYRSRLKIEHFTTMMRMLMRVNLLEPTWSQQKLHYGTLEEPTPQQDELVNILAAQFQLSEGFIVQKSLSRAFDILVRFSSIQKYQMKSDSTIRFQPNFELHFHQLWALIFQPPIPETSSLSRAESHPDSTIRDILRAVSFFVPPVTEFHGKPELHRDIRPVSFEETYQSSMRDSNNALALPQIIKGLTEKSTDHRPHLVLFLGDKAQSHSYIPGIMGALYAAAPKREGNGEQDVSEMAKNFEPVPLQLLFQLQPNTRMFRLKEGNSVPRSLPKEMAQSHAQDTAAKYWMGDHQESEVGLQIDPTRNRVAFVLNDHGANQSEFTYNDVLQGKGRSETLGQNQGEVIRESFTVSQVVVYRVDGGDKFEPRC
ncbi:hypothetical protein N7533_011569 [Penicillium manginii]|uniref:uncharacterized protein n=1 Tax=Penicillium manginii TaxID=203109 RepID=UPI0025499B9F|nr:uncharacterized protein N7533_011569 [Penicillium manginii]KAJ5742160.1 hypothetical protein N7533_011569 [Penicillium manginii]